MPLRILLSLLIFSATICSAQEFTVRVLNENSGKPIAGADVFVQFLDPSSGPARKLAADANGEVRFNLPEDHPEHLSVRVTLKSGHWHCGCMLMADTQAVAQRGLVRSSPSEHAERVAKPGEIAIVARPLTFGERLLYPFIKN